MSGVPIDDATTAELAAGETDTRLSAIMRICGNPAAPLSEAALDALVQCLGGPSKSEQRRAADALAGAAVHDPRIVAKLRGALGGPGPRARWGAAYALGLIGDALDLRAMPALLEALSNRDGDVRLAAAELVVRLGRNDPDAVGTGLFALARGGDLNARKMALYCLRDLGARGEEILALAEACCQDHHSLLKLAALSLVSRLRDGGDRAASIARRLLESDPDAGVRRSAAVALGHIGNRSGDVIDALRRAANDADGFLKRCAEGALRRLGV